MRMPQKTGKWRAREILNRVRMAVECVGEIWKLPSNTSEPEEVKLGLVKDGHLCVVRGNVVHLRLSQSMPSDVSCAGREEQAYVFDDEVDCVGWSSDGSQMLVVGDRAGQLHFICPKSEAVLFSQALVDNANKAEAVFVDLSFHGEKELLVLMADGSLTICRELSPQELQSAGPEPKGDFFTELKNKLQLLHLDLSCEHDVGVPSFVLPVTTPHFTGFISTAGGSKPLCLWESPGSGGEYECYDVIDSLSHGSRIVRSEVTSCGTYLITLSDSGVMCIWLLSTLVMVNIWAEPEEVVRDFVVVRKNCAESAVMGGVSGKSTPPPVSSGGLGSSRLCLLTEDKGGKMCLKVVSMPRFQIVHLLNVELPTQLFHGDVTEETLYYWDMSLHSSVHVKQLVQTLPENQLALLLAQHKYRDAETFAIDNEMDLEVVYKSEAVFLKEALVRIVASSTGQEEEEEEEEEKNGKEGEGEKEGERDAMKAMELLTQCLDKIKDQDFVVDMVFGFSCQSLELIMKMFIYASKRLKDLAVLEKVNSALNKLTTYHMILKSRRFSSQSWLEFLEGSLLVQMKQMLRMGDVQSACCVHNRHMGYLVREVDTPSLLSIFQSVPETVHSDLLGRWVSSYVIPFALQHLPSSMGEVLAWVKERIKLLELQDKENWPSNGIQLATVVLEAVSSFKNPSIIMSIQPQPTGAEDLGDGFCPVSAIRSLLHSLNDIAYLHSTLQCPVTLSQYEAEPREAIVYLLLDKVIAAELVAATVRSKVMPYVQKHSLRLDEVLLKYLKLFLARSPWRSAGMVGSPYESKAVALVQAIQDKELHVTGCLELLKHLQVPWSEGVEELVEGCVKLDSPLVSVLKRQYRLLQLKKLLGSYDVKDFNFSDLDGGKIYVQRMLVSEKPGALVDALEVASMYQLEEAQVYKYHIAHLATEGKLEAIGDVFTSLPLRVQAVVATETLALASCQLQTPFYPELESATDREMTCKLAIMSLRVLEKCLGKGMTDAGMSIEGVWLDIASAVDLHKRLLALQVEYSAFLTPRELANQGKRAELFKTKVADFVEQSKSSELDPKLVKTSHDLYRFCFLIGFTEEEVTNAVVLQGGQYDRVKQICRDIIRGALESSVAPLFLSVVQQLWVKVSKTPGDVTKDDMDFARMMASVAVSTCDHSLIMDAVAVFNLCTFLSSLHSQCADLASVDSSSSQTSVSSSWVWSYQFREEEGLVLDPTILLPLGAQYACSRMSVAEVGGRDQPVALQTDIVTSSDSPLGSDSPLALARRLGELLQGSGHTLPMLHCTIDTLSTLVTTTPSSVTTPILSPRERPSPSEATPSVATPSTIIPTPSMTTPPFSSPLSPLLTQGRPVISAILDTLATKALSSRKTDHDYTLALMLMLPTQQVVPKLEKMGTSRVKSYSRAIALCRLGLDYSLIRSLPPLRERSAAILRSAEWGKRLGLYKVSYTEAFRGGLEERRKVAGALFRVRELDIDTVIQYCCEEVGQDLQLVLPTYLRIILTQWEEQYEARAAAVMSAISNQTLVKDLFANLLKSKVHPYDYQRISFLLQFLQKQEAVSSSLKVGQGLLLLDCLRLYKRFSPPGEYERKWYHPISHSKKQSSPSDKEPAVPLPEAALTHLPFHTLIYGNPMEVIGPEFSMTTVDKLTTIARILKLPMDDFYSSCIKNLVVFCDDSRHGGHVTVSRLPNFGDVAPYLERIRDKSLSLTVARWLTEELKEEQEKTKALETAISIATQCLEQAQSEPEAKSCVETLKVLKTMLSLRHTEQLLQEHQLDKPAYLDLPGARLIMQLYTDVPVTSAAGRAFPPLHSIAAKIAGFFKVSLDKIRNKLCEQWLMSFGSRKDDVMDLTQMSILEDPTEEEMSGPEDEDKLTVKRLVYLLRVPEKLEEHCIMLLNWAKRTTSPVSGVSRVRALQVLLALAPPSTIESISGTTIADIRDFMQSALFVCELEGLHISISLSAFQSCLKEGLVKTLWRNHSHKPKAVRLISELCLYHGVGDSDLWTRTLEKLHDLAMLSYLRYVLKRLASRPHHNVPGLAGIWQKALLTPFESMSVPLSPFQMEECDHCLNMVLECPFPLELELGEVIQQFVRLELRAHALSCMLMIPWQPEREKHTMLILGGMTSEMYTKLLQQINSEIVLGGQQAREVIYTHLHQSNQHEVLLGSEHFPEFVGFLISSKMLNRLLLKTLQAGREQEAKQLVHMYAAEHGVTFAPGVEPLQEYLSQHSTFFHGHSINRSQSPEQ